MCDVIIVGSTGLVGKTLLKIFDEYNFELRTLVLVGNRNIGKTQKYKNRNYKIESIEDSLTYLLVAPLIFFCTNSNVVKNNYQKYLYTYEHSIIIDNSTYFRTEYDIIIPPINKHLIDNNRIYPNPNCVTSGIVMALYSINQQYKIKKIRATSFQSVSGSGYRAIDQLEREQQGDYSEYYYDRQITNNVIPAIGKITEDITDEEIKIINETKKILENNDVDIYATCVRIPTKNCHSVSLEFELEDTNISVKTIKYILETQKMLKISDEIVNYNDCINSPYVYVSRLRKHNDSFFCFISFDNLYRGASYNSYEIALTLL